MKSVLKQRREQYQRQDRSPSSFKSENGNSDERNGIAINSFKETDGMEKQSGKNDHNSPVSKPFGTSSNTPSTPEQPKVIDMLERRKLIFQDSSSSESSDMEFSD